MRDAVALSPHRIPTHVLPKLDSVHGDDDFSASVAWDRTDSNRADDGTLRATTTDATGTSTAAAAAAAAASDPYSAYSTGDQGLYSHGSTREANAATTTASGAAMSNLAQNNGVWDVHVREGKVELEGTSDTFVSYLVTAQVSLPDWLSAPARPSLGRR